MFSLTEKIVKSIVMDSESVRVKEFDSDDKYYLIQVMVSDEDFGRVIGKGGRTAMLFVL